MDNNQVFIAVDGDSAGQLVGRAVLANDIHALHDASERINHGQDIIRDWAQANGGMLISAGGDEGNVTVPSEALNYLEQLRMDYVHAIDLTLTCGVGSTLSEAGKALMVGKLRGKNQICQYDPMVEQEYAKAQLSAENGTATGEGKKLGDAYMKPMNESEDSHADCQYCNDLAQDNVQDEDHCQYCHNEVADDQSVAHCQYCEESAQNQAGHDPMAADHADDCQYCAASNQQANDSTLNPNDHTHEHDDDCVYCQQAEAGSNSPADDGSTPNHEHTGDDCQYCAASADPTTINNPDVTSTDPASSTQDLESIAQEIEQTTPEGESPQDVLTSLDGPGDMPGVQMQDGTSHPDDFQQNVPGPMGLAEDEVPEQGPDLTQVLSSGLDSHADNIQREKVVQMVSEALQGFKSCKGILERAQQQAPQLYDSSIAMLRAMIEMAKMLGLSPQEQTQEKPQQTPEQADNKVADQQAAGSPAEGKLQGR